MLGLAEFVLARRPASVAPGDCGVGTQTCCVLPEGLIVDFRRIPRDRALAAPSCELSPILRARTRG